MERTEAGKRGMPQNFEELEQVIRDIVGAEVHDLRYHRAVVMTNTADTVLFYRAREVFADERIAQDWLNTPNHALNGMTPVEAAAGDFREEVFDVLGRIEHGIIS